MGLERVCDRPSQTTKGLELGRNDLTARKGGNRLQVMFLNADPVLNQTVSLLAQSMRETEDELIRRHVADIKFLVIDLEAYDESYGDRAQAA